MTTQRLVYATGQGRLCPECTRPLSDCRCSRSKRGAPAAGAADAIVRVSRETKGRGGKTVSIVRGLPLDESALTALATQLKKRCGTGGTVREGAIEIQGDHRDTLVNELAKRGYQVKRAGG
jgi:translation initiation factor 1